MYVNTPSDEKTGWKITFESTKSVAGLQFLLLGRMAKARRNGLLLSQTPVAGLKVEGALVK